MDNIKSLELALRICGYVFQPNFVSLTWELTKAIMEKGDELTLKEIIKIQIESEEEKSEIV